MWGVRWGLSLIDYKRPNFGYLLIHILLGNSIMIVNRPRNTLEPVEVHIDWTAHYSTSYGEYRSPTT
jgi:hypothetical protein